MHSTPHADRARALLGTLLQRCRLACERGQGTVEYVALVLLVGAILTAAVGIGGKGNVNGLRDAVTGKITQAIKTVVPEGDAKR
jgi:hypothetical protein